MVDHGETVDTDGVLPTIVDHGPPTAELGRQVRVAVLEDGCLGVRSLTLPPRRPGQVDVLINSAAICGSDLHTVLGHRPAPEVVALGHEAIGTVIDVDDAAIDARGCPLAVGDRVVLSMLDTCGRCDRCRAGLTMKCRELHKYGHDSIEAAPHATGMLADLVRLTPGVALLRVPDDVSDDILVSAGCAGATAMAVLAAAAPQRGESALVLGAGAVGFFCAAMLVSAGCAVTVRDPDERRLAMIDRTGATRADGSEHGFAIVVEASGHPTAFTDALTAADIGARIIAAGSVSPGSTSVTLDPADLVTGRLHLSGVHNYTTGDFVAAVDWLLAHGESVGVSQLCSPPQALEDIGTAFGLMLAGDFARVLVTP